MNLFIGNVSPETTEASLENLFSEFGEILSVKIPVDTATGMPRGFAFVEMADRFESFDAIDNIDQTYFEGTVITVKESKPKNQGGGGGHRGGGNRRFSGGSGNYNSGGGSQRQRRPRIDRSGNRPPADDDFNRL
ncbi:MAG: RNA-binding protein [Flavipsychrobacter sp.]